MNAVTIRLSIMMFLQFFLWGSWYVTGPVFLGKVGFGAYDFGWMYSVGPIAGILSPFFVGLFADRFFATERILGVLHLIGGAMMLIAAMMLQADEVNPNLINIMFFFHMLCYFPTLALSNSLAMHNITDSEKQFPLIRVFGTLGWIAAGFAVSLMKWDADVNMFYMAGVFAIVLGGYSFSLPHTPPQSAGEPLTVWQIFGADAIVLLKNRSYLVFLIASFLICIPLAFYYQMAARFATASGMESPALKMSFGQVSEVFFMVVMPLFFARLGVKWMLFVGMLAWTVRYGLFAGASLSGTEWMVLSGILLHGICYDFFFVTGQIFTDKVAPKKIRSQAQGLLVICTLGLGMFIGAQIGARVEQHYTPDNTADIAAQAAEIGTDIEAIDEKIKTAADAELATLTVERAALKKDQTTTALSAVEWEPIWTLSAIASGVVMILFVFAFKDDTNDSEEAAA